MSEENKENKIDDVVSYNMGGGFDLEVPEIPLPVAPEPEKEYEDEVEGAYKFAFMGAGQGGSRMAEAFYSLGYRRISVINTAQQDLNTINLENKLCIGEGGAGKNPDVAEKLYQEKKEDVLDFMRDSFGKDFDRIFVCAGAGGGSGAGTVVPLIHTARELQESVKCPTDKVGVILALPKISEGKKVNANAYKTLAKVWPLIKEGIVSPLIVVDNERINALYPGLAVAPFWKTANMSIAGLFHLFNLTASKDSSYSSFDSNDYKQILDSGFITFGASPVPEWKEASSITKTVRDNLKSNVLSGGVDLSTGNCAGVIMIGGNEILENVPQENLDMAFEQFTRILGNNSTVHRGIYTGDKPTLTVYSCVGGLGGPEEKMEELCKLGGLRCSRPGKIKHHLS